MNRMRNSETVPSDRLIRQRMTRLVCTICYSSWVSLLLGGQPLVLAQDVSSPSSALMERGMAAFQRGAFETAIQTWPQAVEHDEESSQTGTNIHTRCLLLVRLARTYQALGQHDQAAQHLEHALAIARKAGDAEQHATVLAALGHLHTSTGRLATAEAYLVEGLGLAQQYPQLRATLLNTLGNVFSRQHKYSQALVCYEQGAQLANDQPALLATILTNKATTAFQTQQYEQAYQYFQKAQEQLRRLEPSHDTIYSLITVGLGYRKLQTSLPDKRTTLGLQAFSVLQQAAGTAESLQDRRPLSNAWGYWGALYEERGQYQDALALTRRSLYTAGNGR